MLSKITVKKLHLRHALHRYVAASTPPHIFVIIKLFNFRRCIEGITQFSVLDNHNESFSLFFIENNVTAESTLLSCAAFESPIAHFSLRHDSLFSAT
jgi:hypothetical protein